MHPLKIQNGPPRSSKIECADLGGALIGISCRSDLEFVPQGGDRLSFDSPGAAMRCSSLHGDRRGCVRQKSRQNFATETHRHGGEPRSSALSKRLTKRWRQDVQDSLDDSQAVYLAVGFILPILLILFKPTMRNDWISPCLRAFVMNSCHCLLFRAAHDWDARQYVPSTGRTKLHTGGSETFCRGHVSPECGRLGVCARPLARGSYQTLDAERTNLFRTKWVGPMIRKQ